MQLQNYSVPPGLLEEENSISVSFSDGHAGSVGSVVIRASFPDEQIIVFFSTEPLIECNDYFFSKVFFLLSSLVFSLNLCARGVQPLWGASPGTLLVNWGGENRDSWGQTSE